eukprot:PhM_4_TR4290/c0_g1_i1/m.34435
MSLVTSGSKSVKGVAKVSVGQPVTIHQTTTTTTRGSGSGGTDLDQTEINNAFGIPFKKREHSVLHNIPNPLRHPQKFIETPVGPYAVSIALGTVVMAIAV